VKRVVEDESARELDPTLDSLRRLAEFDLEIEPHTDLKGGLRYLLLVDPLNERGQITLHHRLDYAGSRLLKGSRNRADADAVKGHMWRDGSGHLIVPLGHLRRGDLKTFGRHLLHS